LTSGWAPTLTKRCQNESKPTKATKQIWMRFSRVMKLCKQSAVVYLHGAWYSYAKRRRGTADRHPCFTYSHHAHTVHACKKCVGYAVLSFYEKNKPTMVSPTTSMHFFGLTSAHTQYSPHTESLTQVLVGSVFKEVGFSADLFVPWTSFLLFSCWWWMFRLQQTSSTRLHSVQLVVRRVPPHRARTIRQKNQ
jgi:hypothetical protein